MMVSKETIKLQITDINPSRAILSEYGTFSFIASYKHSGLQMKYEDTGKKKIKCS